MIYKIWWSYRNTYNKLCLRCKFYRHYRFHLYTPVHSVNDKILLLRWLVPDEPVDLPHIPRLLNKKYIYFHMWQKNLENFRYYWKFYLNLKLLYTKLCELPYKCNIFLTFTLWFRYVVSRSPSNRFAYNRCPLPFF